MKTSILALFAFFLIHCKKEPEISATKTAKISQETPLGTPIFLVSKSGNSYSGFYLHSQKKTLTLAKLLTPKHSNLEDHELEIRSKNGDMISGQYLGETETNVELVDKKCIRRSFKKSDLLGSSLQLFGKPNPTPQFPKSIEILYTTKRTEFLSTLKNENVLNVNLIRVDEGQFLKQGDFFSTNGVEQAVYLRTGESCIYAKSKTGEDLAIPLSPGILKSIQKINNEKVHKNISLKDIGEPPFAENLKGFKLSHHPWFNHPSEIRQYKLLIKHYKGIPLFTTTPSGNRIELDPHAGRNFESVSKEKGWYIFILDEEGTMHYAPNNVIRDASHWLAAALQIEKEEFQEGYKFEMVKHSFIAEYASSLAQKSLGILIAGEFVYQNGRWLVNFRSSRFGHAAGAGLGGTKRTEKNLQAMIQYLEQTGRVTKDELYSCGQKAICQPQ